MMSAFQKAVKCVLCDKPDIFHHGHRKQWHSTYPKSHCTVAHTDSLQTAPDPIALSEQTGKVESAFSAARQTSSASRHRKPVLEDYVFYAELQRASDNASDEKRFVRIAKLRLPTPDVMMLQEAQHRRPVVSACSWHPSRRLRPKLEYCVGRTDGGSQQSGNREGQCMASITTSLVERSFLPLHYRHSRSI